MLWVLLLTSDLYCCKISVAVFIFLIETEIFPHITPVSDEEYVYKHPIVN